MKNEETNKIFEDNIRESLINELDWKVCQIERHFFYREIYFNKTKTIIKKNGKKMINVLEEVYSFTLNNEPGNYRA